MPEPTLVLGAAVRIAVPVARSLAKRGIPVVQAAVGASEPPMGSRVIRRSFSFPELDPSCKGLPQPFVEMLQRERIDYIVPCGDPSLRLVAEHFDELSSYSRLACPNPTVIERILDKNVTLALAAQCGIPIPKQLEMASFERVADEFQFPIVAKPGSKMADTLFKVKYFETVDALRAAVDREPAFLDSYLVQEYCPGEGVGVEILFHGGEPRIVFQHRRLTEHPRSGGVSVVAIAESPDSKVAGMAVRLLRAIEWQGVAMVEFRFDQATERIALMEVNGRYWGSLGLCVACGVDFPYAQWAYDHGLTPDPPPSYPIGVRARWTVGVLSNIAEALQHRPEHHSYWKGITSNLPDLSPAIKDMLFSWRDPMPAVIEAVALLMREMKAWAKRTIRRILPKSFQKDLALGRQYGWRLLLTARLRRIRHKSKPTRIPPGTQRVLFVCHGNIMRSVLAERLFERDLPRGSGIVAVSAGLFARPGKPADTRMVETARRMFNIDLSSHSATPLEREHVRQADAIFVMDRLNEMDLLKRFPEASAKLFLLGEFSSGTLPARDVEIPDPYSGTRADLQQCCQAISLGVSGTLATLSRK